MKKTLATILALTMCLGTFGVGAAGKEFTDVKSTDWFYNDVKTAVELGLVNGKGESTYAPADNLTYAEAIKLAACMHQLYTTGKVDIGVGNPWYMPYADYCKDNNIISKEYNYQENATRAGYMEIFANALPGDGLKAINNVAVDAIPDVPSYADYAAGVYKLYRAGILQGVDAAHNCSPLNNITRAEVAAILTRMMNPEKRVEFSLGEEMAEPLKVTKDPIGGALDVGGTIKTNIEVTGGTEPYTYQWEYNDGSDWKNVTADLGTVKGDKTAQISIKADSVASYKVRCVIKDANGNEVVTNETDFTFKAGNKLRIEKEPVDAGTVVGKVVTASVKVAGGTEPYTYQWACDAGTAWYSLVNALGCAGGDTDTLYYTPSAENEMTVRCTITDAKGASVTTKEVVIVATAAKEEPEAEEEPEIVEPEVNEEPEIVEPDTEEDEAIEDSENTSETTNTVEEQLEIVTQPVATTVSVGEDAILSVETAGGSDEITYQWQMDISGKGGWIRMSDNAVWLGTSTPELTVKSNSAAKLLIRCVITDTAKNVRIESDGVEVTFE